MRLGNMRMRMRLAGLGAIFVLLGALPCAAQWTWTPEVGRLVNLKRLPKETPELQVEYARSLLVGGQHSQAFNETKKFRDFYSDSDWADDNQMLRGDIRFGEESYLKSAEEYQLVISGYPESELYDDVIRQQYAVGDTLFEIGQKRAKRVNDAPAWRLDKKLTFFKYRPMKKAIEVYNMVIDNQPFTDTAAEAQFKVGLCYFAREEYVEAAFEYRRVLEDYSSSEWVQEALYGLASSYEMGSHSPEYDQAPSQLTVDMIAQFERQFPDDPRVGEMREVSAQMTENMAQHHLITAKHYEKRSKPVAARMMYELLYEEYGHTEAGETARSWLEEHPADGKAFSAFISAATVGE